MLNKNIMIALTAVVFFTACGDKTKTDGKEELVEVPDTIKAAVVNVGGELFSVPSPIQTALLIQKSGISYDKAVLHAHNKVNTYSTDYLRALNLGIYGADLGYVSLYNNLSGFSNVGLGTSSLRSNTTGNDNTALGTNALYYHNKNDLNTAVGYQAMFSDTSGSANDAMGWNALYGGLRTQQNVAIGTGALEQDSSGSFNTAVGRSAGFHSDSADLITAS